MRGVCEDSPFPLVRPAWAIVKEHIVNNTHAPARFLLTPIFSNIPTLHHSCPGHSYYFAKIGTSSLPASVFMAFLFPYRLPWQTTNPQNFRLPHTHRYLFKAAAAKRKGKKMQVMKQIFVVYETDAWHSTSHRECTGVFTSKWAAVNAIVKNHRIELDEFFTEEEIEKTSKRVLEAEARRRLRKEMESAYQTQGYETNYDIEVWNINEWNLTIC